MKDESHHLKHVQKRVLRSVRRKNSENSSYGNFPRENTTSTLPWETVEVYEETVPSDQQVPRAPMRMRDSFH